MVAVTAERDTRKHTGRVDARTSRTPPPLHGSSLPLLNTMLDAVSMSRPPQLVAAHKGRGTTRHLSQHARLVAASSHG